MSRKLQHFFLLLTIIAVCTFAQAQTKSENISDRLIIGVNNTSYSQLEMESYFFVKDVLIYKRAPISVGANWKNNIDEFTNDMIMLYEGERIGGGAPPDEANYNSRLAQCKQAFPGSPLAKYWRSLPESKMIRNAIQFALKVDNYQSSRQWRRNNKEIPNWFKKLYEASKIRYFDGAHKYRPLN